MHAFNFLCSGGEGKKKKNKRNPWRAKLSAARKLFWGLLGLVQFVSRKSRALGDIISFIWAFQGVCGSVRQIFW